jgi:porin
MPEKNVTVVFARAMSRVVGLSAWAVLAVGQAWAQGAEPVKPTGGAVPAEDSSPASAHEIPWLIPRTDYQGSLWDRPALTGDWGGARQKLMDNGMRLDVGVVQIVQGNTSGGRNYETPTQGGVDMTFQLDTDKAGLWPGGLLKIKGEARYGRDNNANTGAMMPGNFDSLYPVPGEDLATLSELNFTQFLAPFIGVTVGKFSPRESNVFSGDETEQFLNTAFNANPAVATTVPQTCLGAGVILIPHHNVILTTLVLDSEGCANSSGFDTVWDRGTSVYQQLQLTVKPFGLTGHQRVGWTWSDKTRVRLEQDPHELIAAGIRYHLGIGPRPALDTGSEDSSFFYDFDQYVYMVPGSKDRGLGLFGRVGVTDGELNPIQNFYSVGVGGKGLIPGRERDSFGVGYYYLGVSDKIGPLVDDVLANNEQGVEAYYNFAVTPWLKISPDVQVVDPLLEDVKSCCVLGLRIKIIF